MVVVLPDQFAQLLFRALSTAFPPPLNYAVGLAGLGHRDVTDLTAGPRELERPDHWLRPSPIRPGRRCWIPAAPGRPATESPPGAWTESSPPGWAAAATR